MKKKVSPLYFLKNLDAVITAITLTLCVILVNVNVVMRYFLKSPLQWSEEIVTSLFVWTVFIGSAYAHRKHSHLGVDIVVNLIKGKPKAAVQRIIALIELVILVMLTVISAQYVYNLIYVRGALKLALTDVLRIPMWYTGIAVPIGFGLSTVFSVRDLLADFGIIKKSEEEDAFVGKGENAL